MTATVHDREDHHLAAAALTSVALPFARSAHAAHRIFWLFPVAVLDASRVIHRKA